MKVALLECDHVAPAFRQEHGDYREMFPALFPQWEFELFDVVNGQFPRRATDWQLYVCTGSRHSVYEDLPWIHRLKGLVQEIHRAGRSFLGVCFGHQLMAEALGGRVGRAPQGWCVGIHTFELLGRESWMTPFQHQLNLPMLCQDQVLELPPGSIVLARAAHCPTGMYRIGHNMLGVQAHPEFSAAYDKAVMLSRAQRIGQEKVQAALKSFELPIHQQLMAQWMSNFALQLMSQQPHE
ncbi:MAG: amidotransferase [Bacteroidetes bacterium]|nr:MAG: amidotransferase [Bacteroidota bacterium]